MRKKGIEPGTCRCEARALPLDHPVDVCGALINRLIHAALRSVSVSGAQGYGLNFLAEFYSDPAENLKRWRC